MDKIEFLKKYIGTKVDFDGAYGAQCVDLFRQYSKDVNGTPHTGAVEGAKDLFLKYDSLLIEKKYYFKVKAPEWQRLEVGDVLVWDKTASNKYGHVAILYAQLGQDFIVFEQNGLAQDGAKLALRTRDNLLGVLRAYPRIDC